MNRFYLMLLKYPVLSTSALFALEEDFLLEEDFISEKEDFLPVVIELYNVVGRILNI